ncbi:MAG: glyoxalase, partial [Bacteroidota bacterium]|nr:glyoxalase [Bacteroidota bacterium]
KLVPIRNNDWGRECFVHDPSGILWHFGEILRR